jgi:23S rRNA pseudouridine2605 synthase
VVLHKPRGYVSTMSDPEGRPTVAELVKEVGARVVPVGRLDFATSGVLLMSNDGGFCDGLLHPRKDVPKTYVVKATGEMTEGDLERWAKGVQLEDGLTKPARARLIRHESGKTWFEITITEGRNHQIRRMGEATGFRVMRLARVAFAGIDHEGLRPGEWRSLTPDELAEMKKAYGVPERVPKKIVAPAPAPHASPRERRTAANARAAAPSATHHGGSVARHGGASSTTRHGGSTTRHGGGAPGRKPMESPRDWGGGARRGSSEGQGRDERAPREDAPPGRFGRGRTTGTSGGPNAGGGDYRLARPSRDGGRGRGGRR